MSRSSRRLGLVAIPRIERAAHAIGLYLANRPDHDVSQAEAHVLTYLHTRSYARINEIHEEFGHRRSTLTSVLDRLEQRKLLKRSLDPEDRRTIRLTLTAAGQALSETVFQALYDFESAVLRDVTPANLATLLRVLDSFGIREK